jgi:hypothetical protein
VERREGIGLGGEIDVIVQSSRRRSGGWALRLIPELEVAQNSFDHGYHLRLKVESITPSIDRA